MSKISPDKLMISSDFYSVQGEGRSTGVPSYFIRLGLCNLTCGFSRSFGNQLLKDKLTTIEDKVSRLETLLSTIIN
jgi:organic radical activating enzyme